jgi:catechol 2,3-dioxygenase-like lactoylglutathione lyase family enzyme
MVYAMSIALDHIVLPAHDHEASARFFAAIMGLTYAGPDRHFAPVPVSETFTVSFMAFGQVFGIHLGFHVSDGDFEAILSRLQAAGVPYGNDPRERTNFRTDHPFGGRGLFFVDANGHLFEVMTKVRA